MTREKALADLAEKWRKWGEDPTDWGDNHGDTADAALLRPRIATAIYRQVAVELHDALALPAEAPVRASTPTLTAEDVLEACPIDLAKWALQVMANRLNVILAAKSQKGAE